MIYRLIVLLLPLLLLVGQSMAAAIDASTTPQPNASGGTTTMKVVVHGETTPAPDQQQKQQQGQQATPPEDTEASDQSQPPQQAGVTSAGAGANAAGRGGANDAAVTSQQQQQGQQQQQEQQEPQLPPEPEIGPVTVDGRYTGRAREVLDRRLELEELDMQIGAQKRAMMQMGPMDFDSFFFKGDQGQQQQQQQQQQGQQKPVDEGDRKTLEKRMERYIQLKVRDLDRAGVRHVRALYGLAMISVAPDPIADPLTRALARLGPGPLRVFSNVSNWELLSEAAFSPHTFGDFFSKRTPQIMGDQEQQGLDCVSECVHGLNFINQEIQQQQQQQQQQGQGQGQQQAQQQPNQITAEDIWEHYGTCLQQKCPSKSSFVRYMGRIAEQVLSSIQQIVQEASGASSGAGAQQQQGQGQGQQRQPRQTQQQQQPQQIEGGPLLAGCRAIEDQQLSSEEEFSAVQWQRAMGNAESTDERCRLTNRLLIHPHIRIAIAGCDSVAREQLQRALVMHQTLLLLALNTDGALVVRCPELFGGSGLQRNAIEGFF